VADCDLKRYNGDINRIGDLRQTERTEGATHQELIRLDSAMGVAPFYVQGREEDVRYGGALMLSGEEVAMAATDARLPFSQFEILGVDLTLYKCPIPYEGRTLG
jgi:hypothetical protein